MRTVGSVLAAAAAVLCGAPRPAGASPGGSATPVVGGQPAEPGRWDDAAAVFFGESQGCTGTLIAPDLVITAGHCIAGVTHVKLGITELAGEGETIPVVTSIEHPDSFTTYDVGLLILEQESAYTPRVLATGCVLERFLENGAPVAIVGWGATDQQGEQGTNRLMEGQTALTDIDCAEGHGCNDEVNPGGELTAGGGEVDSCLGDSGGPLYLLTDIGDYLVGVTSRGFIDSKLPCGEGGIYVRPDAVLDWVEEQSGRTIPRATCNAPPVAAADPTSLEVQAGDSVIATVTVDDPDVADTHAFAVKNAPEHGQATVGELGNVVYSASDDYDGSDQFVVEVADSGIPSLSGEVTFDVKVLPGEGCGCRAASRDPGAPLLIALAALVALARKRAQRA